MKIKELRLSAAEGAFFEVFLKVPAPLIIYEAYTGKVLEANEKASEYFGIPRINMLNLSINVLPGLNKDITEPSAAVESLLHITQQDFTIDFFGTRACLYMPQNKSLNSVKQGKTENDLQIKLLQQAAISKLGTIALNGADPLYLMDRAVVLIREILDVQYAEILELSSKENMFILRSAAGWNPGLTGNIKIGTGTASEAGYTIMLDIPVIIEDLKKENRFRKTSYVFDRNVVSGMNVVIKGKENPYGILSVHTTIHRKFTDDDILFLSSVSGIISAAVERKNSESLLKAAVKEKELLLKEIHHRVKNNLQVISSLLNLQSRTIKDPESIEIFNESQNRIKSMALIHEKLYQSRNLFKINLGEYINDLVKNLLDSYSQSSKHINTVIEINEIHTTIDNAVALGLIINELASNTFKHAFKNKDLTLDNPGELFINMQSVKRNSYCLTVKDNGSGLPDNLDYKNTSTLGLQLVNTLVEQLDGKLNVINDNGAQFFVNFSSNR